jgi:hypothetical protein
MRMAFDGRRVASLRAKLRDSGLVLALLGAPIACGDDAVSGTGDETESSDTGQPTGPLTSGSTGETSESASDTEPETTGDTDSGGDEVIPPPGGVRRLLGHQYVASIAYLLGPDAAAVAAPPEDPRVGTFDAMATLSSVPSPADVELYEASSSAIAEAVVAEPASLSQTAPCVVDGPFDAACYQQVAQGFGRLAWRRPLSAAESGRLVDIAQQARTFAEGEFLTGVQYMLTAILQSPNFLYIVEVGQPAVDGEPRELDGFELATRLSFFILGRTPDGLTLQNAENGLLDTDEGVHAVAQAMVDSPEARAGVARFFGEFLTVRELPNKGKDVEAFPQWGEALQAAMVEETMRLVDDVAFEAEGSVLDLFTADYTFVNNDLAALYGIAPPGGWSRVTLPGNQERAGVLTHASWLAMLSHTRVNSPTRRGVFVMEQLLCEDIPVPPPRVNPEPVVPDPGQTLRESLESHLTDPGCAACHALTDPIGFAFEHYDPIGRFRNQDNGQPVDATGDVAGIGQWDGAVQLAALVAADPRLPRCLVDKVFTQGLGFVPDEGAEPGFDAVNDAWGEQARTIKRLLVELVSSPVFRQVDEPK